jgi:hypothetical protein
MTDVNRELDALAARVAAIESATRESATHLGAVEARTSTLDGRVERLGRLALWAEVAIVVATIVGVSVSGGMLYLWRGFTDARANVAGLDATAKVLTGRADHLENRLNPDRMDDLARQAIGRVLPKEMSPCGKRMHIVSRATGYLFDDGNDSGNARFVPKSAGLPPFTLTCP